MMACSSERISKSRARSRRVARSDSALNVHVNSSDFQQLARVAHRVHATQRLEVDLWS